jgi:hypothetical protein
MQNNYSHIFSPAELEYLKSGADDYGWYVWTDETRAIIEGLCARRLMAPNGDFKVISKSGERQANLAGHASPTLDILRYYELVGLGRIAFQSVRNQHTHPATSKAAQDALSLSVHS